MKYNKFEYIKGSARTSKPPQLPNSNLLNHWKKDIFSIEGIENYNFWLCGGARENRKTFDIDIIVTGEITTYKDLERILVSATQLGFLNRQLIDINWNNSLCKYIQKGTCNFQSICCENYYNHKTCDESSCFKTRIVESITISDRIIKNGKTYITKCPVEKIGKSLWKRKCQWPSKKHIKKLKSGILYKNSPVLITRDLDFKDVLNCL